MTLAPQTSSGGPIGSGGGGAPPSAEPASQSSRAGRVTIRVVTGESDEFDELCSYRGALFEQWVGAWKRLRSCEKDPHTHPLWVMSFIVAFEKDAPQDLRLVLAYREGELVGVLPFRVRRRFSLLRRRCSLESPHNRHNVGSSSVALPEDSLADVFRAILDAEFEPGRRPAMIHFRRVDEGNVALSVGLPRWISPTAPRSVVFFEHGFEDYYRQLSRNFKNQLRKSRRNLNQLRDVSFEDIDQPAEFERGFETFLDIEASGWKGHQGGKDSAKKVTGNAKRRNPRLGRYYGDTFANLPRFTRTSAHLLHADGRSIAAALCFEHERTLVISGIAYDEEFAKASPGQLLIAHLIENYCAKRELGVANFCGWFEWHLRWKPWAQPTYSLRIFPSGARGLLSRWVALSAREKARWALMSLGLLDPTRHMRPTQ